MIEIRKADGTRISVSSLAQADEVQEAIAAAARPYIDDLRSGDLARARSAMVTAKALIKIADENEQILAPFREEDLHLRMADSIEAFNNHYSVT